MKVELIEGSETSAISTVTVGNYPKENILHIEHGESFKSRNTSIPYLIIVNCYNITFSLLSLLYN